MLSKNASGAGVDVAVVDPVAATLLVVLLLLLLLLLDVVVEDVGIDEPLVVDPPTWFFSCYNLAKRRKKN
jgi:hypothetical protein